MDKNKKISCEHFIRYWFFVVASRVIALYRDFPGHPGPLLEKRQIGNTRREPSNRPGCYRAVGYCLCLNHYTCTQNQNQFCKRFSTFEICCSNN